MADRVWYYSSGGQQQGPVSTAQLKQLATSGELQPGDLVWTDNMANWSPANTVKGLFAAGATEAASTAPASADKETIVHAPTVQPAGDGQYAEQLQAAKEFARQASREAAGAFTLLLKDPIGGLVPCYDRLGRTRALQVGGAFLVVFLLLLLLAAGIGFPFGAWSQSTGETFKAIVRMLVLVVAMVGGMIGVVTLFRLNKSTAGVDADVFMVGTALLPLGVVAFVASILKQSEPVFWIEMALFLVATTFGTLILYTGYTEIIRLTQRIAGLAVAATHLAAFVAGRIVMAIMF